MNSVKAPVDTIIIGSGLTGVALAAKLTAIGISNLIIEKSKAIGGRFATRRINDNIFDHGAQHIELFPHSSSDFKKFITASPDTILWQKKNDHSFYSYTQGMTSLLKHHSKGLNIRFNTRIKEVFSHDGLWHLKDEDSNTYIARNVVSTAPLIQSLQILSESQIDYPQELEKIKYAQKIIALICLNKTEKEIGNSSLSVQSESIKKIYLQNTKRNNTFVSLTCVMSDPFSETHFEKSDEEILHNINDIISSNSFIAKNIKEIQIKKWRYAYPLNGLNCSHYQVAENFYLAGDIFAGPDLGKKSQPIKIIPPKFNPGNNAYQSAVSVASVLTARNLHSISAYCRTS